MNIEQTFRALILAPLASLLVFSVTVIQLLLTNGSLFSAGGLALFILFGLGFLAISYAFVFILGLPMHILLTKLRLDYCAVYLIVGVSSALLIKYLMYSFGDVPDQLKAPGYYVYGFGGFVVSLAFWYIAVLKSRD